MKTKVFKNRYYLIDAILGTLDPTRGEYGYKNKKDAKFELFCSPLEHPVIKSGQYLINNKIYGEKEVDFEAA